MAIMCQCPSCRAGYQLKDELAGRRVKCNQCGRDFRVPTAVPDRHPGPEPLQRPDSRAGVWDKNGIDGPGPPNVCPGCGTVMPLWAIVCINCGYNQRIGRKMATELVPVGAPPADEPLGAGPEKSEGREANFSRVAAGMRVLYWAAILGCAALVIGSAATVAPRITVPPRPRDVGPPRAPVRLGVGRALLTTALPGMVYSLLQIVGRGLCLYAPRPSRAKGLLLASIGLEGVAVPIRFAAAVPGPPWGSHLTVDVVGALLSFAAFIAFLFSLKQLGGELDCPHLSDEARKQTYAFLALGGVLIGLPLGVLGSFLLGASLGMFGFMMVAVLVNAVLIIALPLVLIAAIYLLVRYLGLLDAFRDELLRQ